MGRPHRTLMVKSLPPGKDRADLLDYVRSNYSSGFRRVIYERDGTSTLVFSDVDSATAALEGIRSSTVITLEYAKEDVVFRPPTRGEKEANRILHLSQPSPLLPDELEKIMRCYRGFESYELLIEGAPTNNDHQPRRNSHHTIQREPTPYIIFRDALCAEQALDDLCDYTNICVTFVSDIEHIQKLINQHHHPEVSPPSSRINLDTLSWLHVSNIPNDVPYTTLHSQISCLEGFRFISFHHDTILLGFTTSQHAEAASTDLLTDLKIDVRHASKIELKSLHHSRHPRKPSPPSSSLFIRVPQWLPPRRVVEWCKVYDGFLDATFKKDHLVVTFETVEQAVAADKALDEGTDLYVDYFKSHSADEGRREHAGDSRRGDGEDDLEHHVDVGFPRRRSNFSGLIGAREVGGRARSVDNVSIGSSRRYSAAHLHVPHGHADGDELPIRVEGSHAGHERFDRRVTGLRHLFEDRHDVASSDNESVFSDLSTGTGSRRTSLKPHGGRDASILGCRTIYVGNVSEMEKPIAKKLASAFPGFLRIHFGQTNFRLMFDTPTHAREAMTRIRENHPDWKPSFARKEVEEKIIETVGDESNVIWISTLYWTEGALSVLFSTYYSGFDHLNYQAAHSWVHFRDVQSAKRALQDLNSRTNLYAVFSSKYVKKDKIHSRGREEDGMRDNDKAHGVRHAWETDENAGARRKFGHSLMVARTESDTGGSDLFSDHHSESGKSTVDGVVRSRVSPGAEHFPTRRLGAKRPKQIRSNVLLIRNSAVTSTHELETIFAPYKGFESLQTVRKSVMLLFLKFEDVKSAAEVYGSYELRETLGKGYGGVSFLYRSPEDDDVPNEWRNYILLEHEDDHHLPHLEIPKPVSPEPHHDEDAEHPHHDHDDHDHEHDLHDDDYASHDGVGADPWSLPPGSREATPDDIAAMEANGKVDWGERGENGTAEAEPRSAVSTASSLFDIHRPWYEAVDPDMIGASPPSVTRREATPPAPAISSMTEEIVAPAAPESTITVRRTPSLAELVDTAPVFVPSTFTEAIPEVLDEEGAAGYHVGGEQQVDGTDYPTAHNVQPEQDYHDLENGRPVHTHLDSTPFDAYPTPPKIHSPVPSELKTDQTLSLLAELDKLRTELTTARRTLSLVESEVTRVVKMVEATGVQAVGATDVWGEKSDGLGGVERLERVVKGLVNEVIALRSAGPEEKKDNAAGATPCDADSDQKTATSE